VKYLTYNHIYPFRLIVQQICECSICCHPSTLKIFSAIQLHVTMRCYCEHG
jgi:hypothetical protein